MSTQMLPNAIARVPPGAWAVGVSGGADSVALLRLATARPDLRCHVAHLDHQTRGGASADDAAFVRDLCATLGVPCTVATRSELESAVPFALPRNLSARFRALRVHLFHSLCAAEGLAGVLLAHHADDQAETIVQRLLRGSGPAGLTGMRMRGVVRGLTIGRPLLDISGRVLRDSLRDIGQPWREDASNASPAYQRNRVRALLAGRRGLSEAARDLGGRMESLVAWARDAAPHLDETFHASRLAEPPDVLAAEAARAWLAARGAPPDELSASVLDRLIAMARDAATPPRAHFPGRILVARKHGRIAVTSERGAAAPETAVDINEV